MKRNLQQGVALVITLVLLSVITFLAITFLAVTRREKGSVNSTADQTDARFAADAALERAKIQVLAPALAFSNQFKVDYLVSTNLYNAAGFDNSPPANSNPFTNANYDYHNNLAHLPFGSTSAELDQRNRAIANLFLDPRPPVFVQTSRDQTRPLDFRFYLDLNRNGRYDTNGFLPELIDNGGTIQTNGATNFFVGDPEWIGVLQRPDQPHSSSNKFIARYAYAVVPTSQSLDLNYTHNAVNGGGQAAILFSEGFLRNQGVGSWELNLAAFLSDLNTNVWANPETSPQVWANYQYRQPFSLPNQGFAFSDAFSLLSYRYANNYNSLKAAYRVGQPNNSYFGANNRAVGLQTDLIDEYSDGPLMTNTWLINPEDPIDRIAQPWAGSDNTNHFFSLQDLFKLNQTPIFGHTITNSLVSLGANNSSYDRYTFYRMMGQMGTDSAPDNDKININYDNKVQRDPNPLGSGAISATNLLAWRPIDFFTNAVDKLLRDPNLCPYAGVVSITNIPLWTATPNRLITNFYSPAVHRLLQVAANIYDASGSTNRLIAGQTSNAFPTIFRPLFLNSGTDVLIVGYEEIPDAGLPVIQRLTNMVDVTDVNDRSKLPLNTVDRDHMVFGVPLIVGAKKGFPNFNEVAVESVVQAARRLEFRKATVGGSVIETNQMYTIGITNFWGFEAWNSYAGPYQGAVDVIARFQISAALTNEVAGGPGVGIVATNEFRDVRGIGSYDFRTNVPAGKWPGYPTSPSANATDRRRSFIFTNSFYGFIPNMIYRQYPNGGGFLTNLSAGFPRNFSERFPVPTWGLTLRSRLVMVMVDTTANRIIDYVNVDNLGETVDVTKQLAGSQGSLVAVGASAFDANALWNTNRLNNSQNISVPTVGIVNQVGVSLGSISISAGDWTDYNASTKDKAKGIDEFRVFMGLTPITFPSSQFAPTNVMQAPFNPARKVYLQNAWQANDPLVHYTTGDLLDLTGPVSGKARIISPGNQLPARQPENVGADLPNNRYEPWGGRPGSGAAHPNAYDIKVKDSLMRRSDNWDFPTNRFPNVGWLGRVHRGTPWQTIYMKSEEVNTNNIGDTNNIWSQWTGHLGYSNALMTVPMRDRYLFDHFSAAPNENATHGQLGVNQTELASWSAVLSGVLVLSNNLTDADLNARSLPNGPGPGLAYFPIAPAGASGGANSPLWYIWHGINTERTNTLRHASQAFEHVGDVLSTPELTVMSPYLNTNSVTQTQLGISDAVYERIPQQVMGLLGLSAPRFEIYSYGQSLRPAPRSIVTSGANFGLCTNYQITAEVVTRTVVKTVGSLDPDTANPASSKYQTDPEKRYPLRAVVESFNILPPD